MMKKHNFKHLINFLQTTKIRMFTKSPVVCFCDNKDKAEESPLKILVKNSSSFEDNKPAVKEQQWATLPYPKGINNHPESEHRKPKEDPRDTSIIMFPGQGTQYVGMSRDLMKFSKARDLFELANYILGYDLLKLCHQGPKSTLDQTKYCQPAIFVTSLAAVERLKEERPRAIENCTSTAGFSLGEITALIFAGALGFERGNSKYRFNSYYIIYNSHIY